MIGQLSLQFFFNKFINTKYYIIISYSFLLLLVISLKILKSTKIL
jgi:hypothetical protein